MSKPGKVDLLRVVNATDIGQIIDPPGLEGQLNACWGSAGIDSAIFEETIHRPADGHIVNANLIDYKWRTFAELPAVQNVVLETPFPSHRFTPWELPKSPHLRDLRHAAWQHPTPSEHGSINIL